MTNQIFTFSKKLVFWLTFPVTITLFYCLGLLGEVFIFIAESFNKWEGWCIYSQNTAKDSTAVNWKGKQK